jgi:ribosomal protein S18 acetylase RimI-like enzyme
MTRASEARTATADDAEEIADIARRLGNENVSLPQQFGAPQVREWISRLGDQGTVQIVFNGSIPVAFGAIDFNTTEPETAVLGVWVLPEFRRRGIATDLAESLVEFARERGYRSVRGRLPDGNEPALSFLSSIGAMVPLRNPEMRFELPL